jgi:hypothetical protein
MHGEGEARMVDITGGTKSTARSKHYLTEILLPRKYLNTPYMAGHAQRIQNGQAPKSTAPMDDVSIDAPRPAAFRGSFTF